MHSQVCRAARRSSPGLSRDHAARDDSKEQDYCGIVLHCGAGDTVRAGEQSVAGWRGISHAQCIQQRDRRTATQCIYCTTVLLRATVPNTFCTRAHAAQRLDL